MKDFDSLDVRPYQLMCVICRLGSDAGRRYHFAERLDEIAAAVRADPARPVTLRCNVDSVYAYQNPGRDCDTPEGKLFNDKRDLDVLHRLGLVPGATRPALEIFTRLLREIPTCRGICGYGQTTGDAWRGCDLADSGNYERGCALGIDAVIPPRLGQERAAAKAESCARIRRADRLRIRPHHLMCMTCFHAGRDQLEPLDHDNLFEAVDAICRDPDVPVELIAGPCIICPPCRKYHPPSGLCVSGNGMGLRDQKKDLDVLQLLGPSYGDVIGARELLGRLYERVRSTRQVCGYDDGVLRAPEWHICGGPDGADRYARGRAAGMGVPGLKVDR